MTVAKWRGRFARRGLEGLADEPRPGAARTITDEHIEQVITITLETTPADAMHCSTRRLATRLAMSQTAISRISRAVGLQPHRTEGFKLSRDPQCIEKVRDVVGLYLNPPDRALVLCVDEKPQIQATEGTAPIVPMQPGQPERHTHDSIRPGTTDLFAALDVRAGTVIGETHRRHRSTCALEQALRRYIAATNEHPKPFAWTKPADEILASVARFCQRTSASHH